MLQIKPAKQWVFFQEIQTELVRLNTVADCDIIIGGDFNVIFAPEFDGLKGKPILGADHLILEGGGGG